ncbi:MAG TPA: branched-chain amino acid ABC transporter permease [Firmicutes bacterium]|nr:branched-chain amino acid ABC transporter permease [Bacillota bacterium]
MSIPYIIQQVINGLVLGSIYSLVALGFSLIYSILRLINFAHGDIIMVGAFLALFLSSSALPFWAMVILVGLAGCLAGVVLERIAFRPVRTAPQVTGFITSLAVSSFLQNLGILTLTAQPRTLRIPDFLSRITTLGPVGIRNIDLVIPFLAIVFAILLNLFVRGTKMGIAIRATAENLQVARLMGINVNKVIVVTFAIGSALATIAGVMWGGRYGQVDPLMGFIPGLKAFVAAVIGGVGSLPGALLGGYFLGLSEVLFVGLLPPQYSGYRDAFVFGLLLLVLLVRPIGLLGRSVEVEE